MHKGSSCLITFVSGISGRMQRVSKARSVPEIGLNGGQIITDDACSGVKAIRGCQAPHGGAGVPGTDAGRHDVRGLHVSRCGVCQSGEFAGDGGTGRVRHARFKDSNGSHPRMRLGGSTTDEFIKSLNVPDGEVRSLYKSVMEGLTKMSKERVMLGDSTITEQLSFDPGRVKAYYEKVAAGLEGWAVRGVTTTGDKDLRRMFAKFEVQEGSYILAGHVSIQYHVLLYYRPEYHVVECQKELADLVDRTKDAEKEAAEASEDLVGRRLAEAGHEGAEGQKLFEAFYQNDGLIEGITQELEEGGDRGLKKMEERKLELFKELDSLLTETYQTTGVLIDDARLVSGEEGVLYSTDIEFLRGSAREGLFDPRKVPAAVQEKLIGRLGDLLAAVKAAGASVG
ncbi:hypothetical protein CENSYa_0841 [Cenarchaeum symbiosum A]|uniref:Uncharacterized protein n=1 Tax=Cenarchaeum symbiosum (strain A) TaxID=414004 RepID=A0RVV7_CENSY|nr:hypothetical protein CENSYa_0841 [Cenarchaeum symbiosum A]